MYSAELNIRHYRHDDDNNNNISNTVGRKEKGCRLDHMRSAATWWGASTSPVPGR